MTFPLPLTPFEEYMLRDGTPSHPMEFFFRLSFDGPLDRAAVDSAAATTFHRHPLLAARIAERPGRRPRFEPASGGRIVDAVSGRDTAGLPPIPALDPETGPLARLLVVERPDGPAEILAQFHHAACDGLGALAFLGDFCMLLGATLGGARPGGEAPDPHALRRRGRYGLDCWKLLHSLPSQARGLEGVWKFMRHRPVGLGPANAASDTPRAHVLQRAEVAFTEAEARNLRRSAQAADVSLNELAAAALLEALSETVPRGACPHSRAVLRLSIPMNMRRPADRRAPAANIVSMVFLDRRPAEIAAPGLAASLHREMQLVKRLGLGMTFLFTLAAARCLPGGIAGLVTDRSTAATALFTNLGRVFARSRSAGGRTGLMQVGPLRLVAVEPLAPLRRGTSLAVAAAEYAGRLSFTLRTDPGAFDLAATTSIRDAFARRLRHHGAAVAVPAAAETPAVVEACA